jgi:hypothetical protein
LHVGTEPVEDNKKEIDLAKQENEYRPKGEGKRPC